MTQLPGGRLFTVRSANTVPDGAGSSGCRGPNCGVHPQWAPVSSGFRRLSRSLDGDVGICRVSLRMPRRFRRPSRVAGVGVPQVTWEDVLTQVIDESHAVTGDQLSAMTDRAVRPLGLTAEVLAVDLAQQVLTPVHSGSRATTTRCVSAAGRCPGCSATF
jgi:hypothetical protein